MRTRFGLRLERRSFFRDAYRMLQECHEAQWQTIRKRMLTKNCHGHAGGLALLATLELTAASLAPTAMVRQASSRQFNEKSLTNIYKRRSNWLLHH